MKTDYSHLTEEKKRFIYEKLKGEDNSKDQERSLAIKIAKKTDFNSFNLAIEEGELPSIKLDNQELNIIKGGGLKVSVLWGALTIEKT